MTLVGQILLAWHTTALLGLQAFAKWGVPPQHHDKGEDSNLSFWLLVRRFVQSVHIYLPVHLICGNVVSL